MTKNKEEQETEEAGGHPLCKTPKETEEIEEESDLEEDLEESFEDVVEIDDEKFVEFLAPSNESSSTSLGQIAISSELRATDLERDISGTPFSNENKGDKEEFKYNIGSSSEEGPKYISSGNEIERTFSPLGIDVMSLGKELNLLPHEVGFSSSPSTKAGMLDAPGKYELPDRFDVDKSGKGKLFEKTDVKYKPSNEY